MAGNMESDEHHLEYCSNIHCQHEHPPIPADKVFPRPEGYAHMHFLPNPEQEDMNMLPDRIEYYLDEDWVMTSPGSEEQIKVDLPYSGIFYS